MAITCTSTITVVDIQDKIVSISADITNDTEPTFTVTVRNADISTAPKKALVAGVVWAKYIRKRNEWLALQNIQPEIDQLESDLNANIEGRTV